MKAALALRLARVEVVMAGIAAVTAAAVGAVIALPGGPLGAGRALLAVVAVAVAVATLADLRAGIFFVVLFLALPVPVEMGGFDVHPAHLVVALFALRAAGEAWVGRAHLPAGLLVPILTVLVGALVASAAGPRFGGSLFRLIDVFALPLVSMLAVAAVFEPRRDLRVLVLACAAGLTAASLAALLQSAGFTVGRLAPVVDDRANALFEHPNVLGGFVAPLLALLIGVAACAWSRVRFAPVVLVLPLLLGLAALVLTLSRGALAGLAGALVVMFLLLIAQRRLAALFALLLVIVAGLVVALPQLPQSQRAEFGERVQQLFRPGTETGRELIYHQAVRMLADYPLTGVGPLTFGKLTRESTPIPDIEPGREHAHNLFLEGALSLGPLGLLGVLWLVGGAALHYYRRARAPADALELGWTIGAIAAMAAMLVQGMGDFIFSNLEPLTLLAVLIGVGYAFRRPQQAPFPR
jgi:putative inorganic carbon (HCO3(-)) transporter